MLAHITKDKQGEEVKQSLKEHSLNTANYAKDALKGTGFESCAYLAGILHDMGKAKEEFQDYLIKGYNGEKVVRGSVNHTFAGVIYLLEKYHILSTKDDRYKCLTAEILSFAIGSHHGLFDCCDLEGNNGFEKRLSKNRDAIYYDESVKNFIDEVVSEEDISDNIDSAINEVKDFFNKLMNRYKGIENGKSSIFFMISMICRMILSAVIYADRKDTIEFTNQIKMSVNTDSIWDKQCIYFEDKISKFDLNSDINKVRNSISNQCYEFAKNPSGINIMDIPTGGGKTLCSLRYSLTHAKIYNKKRIFFIIPLLAILDQNAEVIKDYVEDEDIVLEHHSNVVNEEVKEGELDYYELLTTTYDSPIIITTMVQFLNVLFSYKTSAIGRFQAFNDSVIVIDEIQSLPKKTVLMFNMAMNFLSEFCNCSIVLSSATQPCFDEVKWKLNYSKKPNMVILNEEEKKVFDRVKIINDVTPYGLDTSDYNEYFSNIINQHSSVLVITNTKKEALEIFKLLSDRGDIDLYHLSTLMCKKHRKDVLDELNIKLTKLQNNLKQGKQIKKIVCVSTQLVEAGVDFSFEAVVRALAGLDNLAQAAGRCNRSGEYLNGGTVYLFKFKNEKLKNLPDIKMAQDATQSVLYKNDDILGEKSISDFFNRLYYEAGSGKNPILGYPFKYSKQGDELGLANLWANINEFSKEDSKYLLHQPFLTMGKVFSVFDNNTLDVIVPYGDAEIKLKQLEMLVENNPYNLSVIFELIKELKEYTIGIYDYRKEALLDNGILFYLLDEKIYYLNTRAYDNTYGLDVP
ncbi:MAG: CRISPR-associated helicase Cas3' [Lachnospiraceae bacterium]|nr:CRISPR-associated helicase Cas3' [Lachnospiraceae bacterium]